MKRQDCCRERYQNICLLLNDGEHELCTPYKYGFQVNDLSDTITWKLNAENVDKVSLVFRSSEPAQIAELNMFHIEDNIQMWNNNNQDVTFTNIDGGFLNEAFTGIDF